MNMDCHISVLLIQRDITSKETKKRSPPYAIFVSTHIPWAPLSLKNQNLYPITVFSAFSISYMNHEKETNSDADGCNQKIFLAVVADMEAWRVGNGVAIS